MPKKFSDKCTVSIQLVDGMSRTLNGLSALQKVCVEKKESALKNFFFDEAGFWRDSNDALVAAISLLKAAEFKNV